MANQTLPYVASGVALALTALTVTLADVSCSHLPDNAQLAAPEDGGPVSECPEGGYCLTSFATSADAALPAPVACTDQPYGDPWTTPGYQEDPAVEGQTGAIIDSLSITDMASQMRGTNPNNGANYGDIFRTLPSPSKDIRGFLFRDGPRGVCLSAQLPEGDNGYSTAFPVPSGRAATFDVALEEKIGEDIGDEVVASGNTMLLAPVINILRHPAWGRAEETYGEDSYVLGRFGAAFTTGGQQYLPLCVKHYAGNNVEGQPRKQQRPDGGRADAPRALARDTSASLSRTLAWLASWLRTTSSMG